MIGLKNKINGKISKAAESSFVFFLIFTAVGLIYSDVLIFRVAGFAVTLVHLNYLITTLVAIFLIKRINIRIAILAIGFFLLELCHSLMFKLISHPEWQKSFFLLFVYIFFFCLIASVDVDLIAFLKIETLIRILAVAFSGIGIIQFFLFNNRIDFTLPKNLRAMNYDPFAEIRSGNFIPVNGIASEPSFYATGLVTLLGILIFFDSYKIVGKKLTFAVSLSVLIGIICSFSASGIIAVCLILFISYFKESNFRKIKLIILLVTVGCFLMVSGVSEPIKDRFEKIFSGSDNSANIRVESAMRLLFMIPDNVEYFLLGTGLGMEDRDKKSFNRIYNEKRDLNSTIREIKIHNIFTAIRFLQGWLGVVLYTCLLWAALRIPYKKYKKSFVLFTLLAVLHFTSGLYIYPTTWATLGLVTILRKEQLAYDKNNRTRQQLIYLRSINVFSLYRSTVLL
jgi:O-antigen ligase